MKQYFTKLFLPSGDSHKGQNGRLLIIGGSKLFHAASLWSLSVASRIVDLVHYASVPENNKIVHELKKEFRNGIVIPRSEIEKYIEEDDCVLIGPGMVRVEYSQIKNVKAKMQNVREILALQDEGIQTYYLTKYLLQKYPQKKWVIDAGALQMMELGWIPKGAVLTPHRREFDILKIKIPAYAKATAGKQNSKLEEQVKLFAKQYQCVVLLKGVEDIVTDGERIEIIKGGNAGMTKGGTGDVLAGLVAALACKNDPFRAAVCASYINKKAGDRLFNRVGYYFNASDLAGEIPAAMKELLV